jgi:hypothetical protein
VLVPLAHAVATSDFGASLPGVVGLPRFSMNTCRSRGGHGDGDRTPYRRFKAPLQRVSIPDSELDPVGSETTHIVTGEFETCSSRRRSGATELSASKLECSRQVIYTHTKPSRNGLSAPFRQSGLGTGRSTVFNTRLKHTRRYRRRVPTHAFILVASLRPVGRALPFASQGYPL